MLYLEDYLEMIENLPMEMRDRFTEMREMDLQVQNAMDSLEEQVKTFFGKCGTSSNTPKQEWKDEQFDNIKKEYGKALEDADEKVQLTNQIYELVERHLRKLDQEVSKFKMELEADNAGITEMLEKRSLELDAPPHVNHHRAEKRKYTQSLSNHTEKRTTTDKVLSSLANEAVRESLGGHRSNSTTPSPANIMFNSTSSSTPAISYSLGHMGAGSNAAIAAAASRAIGATLEMQQGRRTASLKASYEAVSRSTDLAKDLQLTKDYNTPSTPSGSTPEPTKSSRTKKATARAQQQQQQQQQQPTQLPPPLPPSVELPPILPEAELVTEEVSGAPTWQYDPNEPRYCVCNDVSYGDMVGCDNEDCPIEWFHYGCVGLNQAPKGKWYCPQCTAAMRRRGRK
ncbi:hypothetical protein NP493_154g03011 [Ridgeia piscesae]|uniref:Inhibitor of growth protein n=1 Tax=Ridgeia piscesae TaxID=27915 RepID=A0AAD9UFV3_RIDPI|nr:hypothetical protein NP493_154g03011 [Ridgeia piscesae]